MNITLNKNVQVLELSLPASGTPAAPVIGEIRLVDNVLTEFWAWASAGGAYFTINDVEATIAPVFGWLPIPTSPLNPELEREISGPPWVLEIKAYNPGASPVTFYLVVAIGNNREKDVFYQILTEAERTRKAIENKFLGIAINEPPEG